MQTAEEKMKVLVIHLSDIHIRDSHANPCLSKFNAIPKAVQNLETGIGAAALVISGDIAFGGKRSEYELFNTQLNVVIGELITRLKVGSVRVVIVPGNHDCDFSEGTSVRDVTIDAIRNGRTPDPEMVEFCCAPQTEFDKFRKLHSDTSTDRELSPLHWETQLKCGDKSVGFRCFNTAWMSVLHEVQGTLQVPESVLKRTAYGDADDYVVTIFHHPYNWMPADTFRRFKRYVESSSDLILTGHEHEPDHVQKYSYRSKETNDYLEGAVFQEHGQADRSGFHAVVIDLHAQRQRVISFDWNGDHFTSEDIHPSWAVYKRGARSGKRDFDLTESFSKWLNDPGASYQHSAKPDLTLADIYVFPNLKPFEINKNKDFVYGVLLEGRDILKVLGSKNKVLIFGRQQSGKTTLAKVLFSDFYSKNITPVLMSGEHVTRKHLDPENLRAFIEECFAKQYTNPLLPAFSQLDQDKCVLIIDDLDHSALNSAGRLKLIKVATSIYERVIVFADDSIKLEELAVHSEASEALIGFDQYEILQFGHLLRSKLITQWHSLGREYDSDPAALNRRIHLTEQLVSAMLGKNYLPHYPVFILALIQASESTTRTNTSAGTYGSLYEVIITQSLAAKKAGVDLDTKIAYLSELAHWMHTNKRKRISEEDWAQFHDSYCKKFKIRPSKDSLQKDLTENGILDFRDERYGFRHSSSYYYFAARYLRDNLALPQIRELVTGLLSKLHKEENASIWLFLTHLSKDPFLLDAIISHSTRIYSSFGPIEFDKDCEFLGSLADSASKIVLEQKSFGELKTERLRNLDSAPVEPEVCEGVENAEEETNEALRMVAQLTLALRTLEVLGQLVKNFPGSLAGEDKLRLVRECYSLGLRTISMIFDLFQKDIDGFVDFAYSRLLSKHPEISDREELKRKIKGFMFWLIENSTFGLIKRIAQAAGHSQLGEVYKEIRESKTSNAIEIVDIAIRLENLGFPEERLVELAKLFTGKILCERLLKNLVVEHFYLFPTPDATKQKVCASLGIEIKKLAHVDVAAVNERLAPKVLGVQTGST